MPDPKPILIRARELIADPEHWTQHEHAQSNAGAPVSPFDPDAYCFCIDGALLRATAERRGELEELQSTADLDAIDEIARVPEYALAYSTLNNFLPGRVSPISFNDEHTHADVLALLDKALADA
jgi:hypothetical protein